MYDISCSCGNNNGEVMPSCCLKFSCFELCDKHSFCPFRHPKLLELYPNKSASQLLDIYNKFVSQKSVPLAPFKNVYLHEYLGRG